MQLAGSLERLKRIGLILCFLIGATIVPSAYIVSDTDGDSLRNYEDPDPWKPNPAFVYAKAQGLPPDFAYPLDSCFDNNAKTFIDMLVALPPNARKFLLDLALHADGTISNDDLLRARDLDQDGMSNEFETRIGTNMLKPSIYPYLNNARKTAKDTVPRFLAVQSDLKMLQSADTSTIQKTLDWTKTLEKNTDSSKAHINDAKTQVSTCRTVQEAVMRDIAQLSGIWNHLNASNGAKLEALRAYNLAHMSESVVNYDSAKGTLAWHINSAQEGELNRFNQDQNGQHFERVVALGREGIGESIRLQQILEGEEYVLDSTKLPTRLFLRDYKGLTQPINVPGYVQLVDLQSSMKEPLRQLDSQLFASSQDIGNLGKFWTDIENEYVIQPKDRPAFSRLYEKTGTSKNALRKMIEGSKSGLEIAKLHHILNNTGTEDVDLVVTAITNAIEAGKALDDVCNVATGLIHELSYGRKKSYEEYYGRKGFSKTMTAVCSSLPANHRTLSDSQLYYEIMKTSAFPAPGAIYYIDARRLLSGILNLSGRNTFSTVAYALDEQAGVMVFATLPTIHENSEYLLSNAWKDAANIPLLKVQQAARERSTFAFLITQPLFGGYHSIIKATYLP